ncbi:MAG: hypothetical protein Q8M56_13205, partial [Desulfobacterales bacterium]|nr:hypothetical protein [Desulfobacterales bacterium]
VGTGGIFFKRFIKKTITISIQPIAMLRLILSLGTKIRQMKNKTTILMLSILGCVIFLHILSLFTVIYLTWPISTLTLEKASALGGSYGVLGTLFSGLAFWGLIWTILIQRNEIRRQRINSKRDRISDLLLSEAKTCLDDLQNIQFTTKNLKLFPNDKTLNQWQFFYNVKCFMAAASDGEITNENLINELTKVVMENIEELTYFYERLDQACDVARYMLADDEIPIKELGEIKLLFFSRFNDDIFFLSGLMKGIFESLIENIRKKQEISIHHPLPSILSKIGSINQFREQEVDEKFVQSWQWTLGKKNA